MLQLALVCHSDLTACDTLLGELMAVNPTTRKNPGRGSALITV